MNCNCGNNISQDDLRLVRGNDFGIIYPIRPKYPDGSTVEDFDLNACTDLSILIRRDGGSAKDVMTYAESYVISGVKELTVNYDGLKMRLGSYRLDISGKFGGKDWRSYSRDEGFGIVESNEEANIPVGSFIADGVYTVICDFLMTYQTQEQADWEETDTSLPSYIKNKPDVSNFVEKEEGYGLSENNYSDADKEKVQNAVTSTTLNLVNYYLKSETYTRSEILELVSSMGNFHYEIYASISAITSPTESALYLIGPTGSGADRYEEYVYFDGAFEKIGDTSIDLSGYVTTSTLNSALANYVTSSTLATTLLNYQEALVSGTNIKTVNSQSILGSGNIEIQGGGEENVIEIVKVNGTALTPDANKAVDVTVPTESTVSGWGFTKNTGTYSKPSSGIPKTDLASDVQTSLGKADTALQSESDPTVPSWAKASSKPSYTASEVGAVPTTRTVNGKALSADITLSASDVNALPSSTVIPDAQIQSDWNQATTTAKDYIKNKPTIPAAQVNSDWNASSGVAQILNKPTIPAAGIPAGGNAGQVLTKTDGSTDYAVAWRDTNNIFPSAYCTTAAATAAKAASCTLWTATANSYLHILITKANSNQGALTLNVNSTGAAPIYINGSVSSSTNYTLPAGSYIVFYDGTNYYFRTDGKLTASITGTAAGTSVVNHGTSDTTFALTPNILHIWGTVASLTLTLATPTNNTIVNEYMIEFTSGSTATTLSLPATVTWAEAGGDISVEANKTYQISIVNNIGLWTAISNS